MLAGIGALIVLVVLYLVIPLVLIALAYPYMALRLRDSREEKRDPELGIKAAYYLILSAAIMLILFGATVVAIDVMDGTLEKKNQARQQQGAQQQFGINQVLSEVTQRTAWGIIVSGVLFSLTMMLLLKASTNDVEFPAAKRVFVGGRLAITGVIVMLALTALIVLFFQKEVPSKEPYEILVAILMVWLPALAVHIFLMRMYRLQPYHVERVAYSARRHGRSDEEYLDDDD